jgi:hypothetical protein
LTLTLPRTRVYPRPAPSLFYFPGIGSRPLYDTEADKKSFQPYIEKLTNNYSIILEEYLKRSKNSENKTESDYVVNNDEHKLNNGEWLWSSYILKGKKQAPFHEKYPETVKIFESFSSLTPKLMLGQS